MGFIETLTIVLIVLKLLSLLSLTWLQVFLPMIITYSIACLLTIGFFIMTSICEGRKKVGRMDDETIEHTPGDEIDRTVKFNVGDKEVTVHASGHPILVVISTSQRTDND